MKIVLLTIAIFASLASLAISKDRNNKPFKVVCYFESWADYSKGDAHFVAEDINPAVCTHIMYAFSELKNNSIALMDPTVDVEHHMLSRLVKLRKHNPHLSILISLGGWAEGSTKYSEMVRSAEHRKVFVKSVLDFLKRFDLDGLDIDWEYPAFSGEKSGDRHHGRTEDKHDYVTLLKELKEAFKQHGYLLSAAVAAGMDQMERSYDIPGLNKYLDFINIMSYDYWGESDGKTGHNAPLSGPGENIHTTIDFWLKHGADSKKLILGLPLYGKGFKVDGSDHKVGTKAHPGHEGGNYNKICKTLKQPGWVVHWDNQAEAAFATKGQDWVSFDNVKSITKKLNYVIEKKLGGSMVWAIDGDDFHGACGEGKYPLMKLQMKMLNHVDVADVAVDNLKPEH